MKKLATGQTDVIDPKEATNPVAYSGTPDDILLEFIKRRHPTYESKTKHWSFLDSCYEGGREWFDGENIFRYVKEGDLEYKARVNRAYRFNHSREVVDLVNKYLFKQNITRNEEDAPNSVKEFWKNSSKSGLKVDDLSRQISLRSSVQGRIGVVIDNNNSVAVLSKAEQKKNKIRCYAYVVKPEQILDYAFDDDGQLLWIKLAEIKRDDVNPILSTGGQKIQYRLWTRNDWTLFEVVKEGRKQRVVVVDSRVHALGRVPVVLVDNVISDRKYDSPALIDDIAYLDRAVANYLSNIDAIIQDQTYSQLAMPAQGVLPGEKAYDKLIEMGTKRIFLFDGEAGQVPFYLSPDVKQAELILSVINKIINEIYHTVGLAGERTKQDNAIGIDNSSGVAKAYDFEKVNALLSAKAHSLENAENEIASIVALWNGESVKENIDLVSYPDNFDTRGLYDEFEIAGKLMLVGAPDEVRREQMASLIDKLFPQLTEKLKVAIKKELMDWPPKEELSETETGSAKESGQVSEGTKKSGNQGAVSPDTDNS
jgi:hypothetical protein